MYRLLPRPALSLILLICSLLLTAVGSASAADSKIAADQQVDQLQKVQKKYQGLTSLSFDFHQTVQSNGRRRQGEGNCIFYRSLSGKPGIMRWNYTQPDQQIILNDGKDLSIYTQKDKQLIVAPAGDLQSDITYSFFAGNRNLLDDFTVFPADGRFVNQGEGDKKLTAVRLVPRKPHGQVKTVHLWFDDQFSIRKLVMEDHFDTVTELVFSKVKFDALPADSVKIAKELVQLDLPPDTEVVKQ